MSPGVSSQYLSFPRRWESRVLAVSVRMRLDPRPRGDDGMLFETGGTRDV
jgi:hypothetical protein